MNKPYVFLDVDGVINALAHDENNEPDFDRIDVPIPDMGAVFSITMRHRVKRWLCEELPELADVRWNTTWEDNANTELCEAFGIPVLQVAGRCKGFQRQQEWKLEGVLDVIEVDPRPFVWIDDVVCDATAERRLHYDDDVFVSFMLVQPNPYTGITDDEITKINYFLEAQTP